MAKNKGKKGKQARKAEKKAAKKARKAKASTRTRRPARKAKLAKAVKVKAAPKARAAQLALTPRRQPESLRLRATVPSFTVSDIHESTAYYRDVLGFQVGEHWEEDGRLKGVELVAGAARVWLGQDDWKKGTDRVKGQGFRIGFETAQDIDMLAERVRAAGGVLADGPKDQPWGGRYFSVSDPDGFLISFSSGL